MFREKTSFVVARKQAGTSLKKNLAEPHSDSVKVCEHILLPNE